MGYDIGPKVGLEGEAEFKRSIGEINAKLKTLGTEMKAVSSQYAKNDKSVEATTKKNEVLTKQIAAQKTKLDELKQMLAKAKEKYGENAKETQSYMQQVNNATASLNKMKLQLNETTKKTSLFGEVLKANLVSDAIKGGIRSIISGLKKMGNTMIESGKEFDEAMAKTSTLFGGVKVDTDGLNQKILELSSSTGIAAKEIGESLYSALSAGIPATEDMGQAMDYMGQSAKLAKAGFTDINTATVTTAKVLNAYKMDISKTGDIQKVLIQIQNKGITTVGELGQTLAQVTPTAAAMNVQFEQVGASLANLTAQGTPTAQATTQLNALFAELGKQGTVAQKSLMQATAGTQYAGKSFQQLMEAGVPLNDLMDMIGNQAKKSGKSMQDMFSSLEAGKAALAVSGQNSKQFAENLKAMGTSADVVEEAYEKMDSTLSATMEKIHSSVQNKLIDIFEKSKETLGPQMEELVTKIQDALNGIDSESIAAGLTKIASAAVSIFSFLIAHGSEVATAITAIGAAFAAWKVVGKISGLMDNFQKALKTGLGGFAAFTKALNANPFMLIVTAIAAVVTAIITLWNTNEKFRNTVKAVWAEVENVIGTVVEKVKGFFSALKGAWEIVESVMGSAVEKIKGFFSSVKSTWETVGNFFTKTIPETFHKVIDFFKNNWQGILLLIINPFAGAFKLLYDNCAGFREKINSIFNAVVDFFKGLPEKIKEFLANLPENIGYALGSALKAVMDWGKNLWKEAKEAGTKFVKSATEQIKALPGEIWNWLKETVNKIMQWGMDMQTKMAAAVKGAVTAAIEKIKALPGEIWNWLKETVKKVADWDMKMQEKMAAAIKNAVNAAIKKIKALPGEIWNWLKKTVGKLLDFAKNAGKEAKKAGKEIVDGVIDAVKHLPDMLKDVGKWVVEGFTKGIKSAWGGIKNVGHDLADGFKKAFTDKKGLDTHSPSKWAYGVAGDTVDGFANGIKDNTDKAKQAAADLSKSIMDTSTQWISKQKARDNLSMADEVAAWERVTQKEGLLAQDRETAEQNLYNAKKQLADKQKELYDKYQSDVQNRADSLKGFAGLFDEVAKQSDISGQQLLDNLQGQVDAFKGWQKDVTDLAQKGIDEGLLKELRDMGPKAADQIHALNTLTGDQLTQYVALWKEKTSLAADEAQQEIGGFKLPVELQYDKQNMQASTDAVSKAAGDTVKTMSTGIEQGIPKVAEAIKHLTKKYVDTAKADYPKYKDAGLHMDRGLLDGITSGKSGVINGIVTMLQEAIAAAKETLEINSPSKVFTEIGNNLTSSMGGGVSSGVSHATHNVVTAVKDTVHKVTSSIKHALGIHSPSIEYSGIGENMAKGIEVGFVKQMQKTTRQIKNSIPDPAKMSPATVTAKIGEGVVNGIATANRAANMQSTTNGPIIIQVKLDSKIVAEQVFDPLKRVAQKRGVAIG